MDKLRDKEIGQQLSQYNLLPVLNIGITIHLKKIEGLIPVDNDKLKIFINYQNIFFVKYYFQCFYLHSQSRN